MEALFWISVFVIFYTFVGYGIVITLLASFKKKKKVVPLRNADLPFVTLLIAAYNEEEIIEEKIKNSLSLDYPLSKLKIAFVTDGSTDKTCEIIKRYPGIRLFHKPARKGKIAAINRVMPRIKTPITIFSDANVMINSNGLRSMISHFQSNLVGAVSGEKVVSSKSADTASSSGEGFYWKYESFLKRKDAEWNTLVGAAGELFAIRTQLYENIHEGTLIEDFQLTMGIASNGYKVAYEPTALAVERGSADMNEEKKRKVRISAGGIQAVIQLSHLLNPLGNFKLFFQYLSHRVLRWTFAPVALVTAFLFSGLLMSQHWVYALAFFSQVVFYLLACLGYSLRNQPRKSKIVYVPYYFTFMHICVVQGWMRYFNGSQKVTWDKAKRAGSVVNG